MRAKMPSMPSMMRASPSQAKTSSQAPDSTARVANSAQTAPSAVKRCTRAAGQAMRIHILPIHATTGTTNTKERQCAPLACRDIRRWQSESMLDRPANLHVAGLGLVLGQAFGFGCAIEQLQPEVELGENADLADAGNAHLGARPLTDAQLGHLQVQPLALRWRLGGIHAGHSGLGLIAGRSRCALFERQHGLGKYAQQSANGEKEHRPLHNDPASPTAADYATEHGDRIHEYECVSTMVKGAPTLCCGHVPPRPCCGSATPHS